MNVLLPWQENTIDTTKYEYINNRSIKVKQLNLYKVSVIINTLALDISVLRLFHNYTKMVCAV